MSRLRREKGFLVVKFPIFYIQSKRRPAKIRKILCPVHVNNSPSVYNDVDPHLLGSDF